MNDDHVLPVADAGSNTAKGVDALRLKVGEDAEALSILTTLAASWNKLALLYAASEARHRRNASLMSSWLSELGKGMASLGETVESGDAKLDELHKKIMKPLNSAARDISKANKITEGIIAEYNSFSGNLNQLKKGMGTFVKGTILSINPAIASWAGPAIDRMISPAPGAVADAGESTGAGGKPKAGGQESA